MKIKSIDFIAKIKIGSITYDPLFSTSIRGTIGHILREKACVFDKDSLCKNCVGADDCLYQRIFSPYDKHKKISIPRGFVIQLSPPEKDRFHFRINLFGDLAKYEDIFIECVDKMSGRLHLNKSKVYFDMSLSSSISEIDPFETSSDITNRINIFFLTPTFLSKKTHKYKYPGFESIIRHLSRRYLSLNSHYNNNSATTDTDLSELIKHSKEISDYEVSGEWGGIKRYPYSKRNEGIKEHYLTGFTGKVTYSGNNLHRFIQILRFGEYSNVGKNTSQGMGRYIFETF